MRYLRCLRFLRDFACLAGGNSKIFASGGLKPDVPRSLSATRQRAQRESKLSLDCRVMQFFWRDTVGFALWEVGHQASELRGIWRDMAGYGEISRDIARCLKSSRHPRT